MATRKDFVVKNGLVVGETTDSATPGQLSWDPDHETIHLVLDENVTANIGQDAYFYVKAPTGMTKGSPMFASGAVGSSGKIEATPFIADNSVDEKYLLGIAAETVAAGEFGFVTQFGQIRQLDTTGSLNTTPETWTDGTVLYASPYVAGELTSVEPNSAYQDLPIAFVIKAHANGTLHVRTTNLNINRFDAAGDAVAMAIALG